MLGAQEAEKYSSLVRQPVPAKFPPQDEWRGARMLVASVGILYLCVSVQLPLLNS